MTRVLALFVLSLAASGAALACGGAPCDKACAMPASTASAEAAPLPADGTKVKLAVTGMTCGSCADKVKTALLGVEGVKGANVDAKTGVAEVVYDEKKANNDKLVAAVAALGHFGATVATN